MIKLRTILSTLLLPLPLLASATDPNISIPKSNLAVAGHMHTNYLIYKGVPYRSAGPIADMLDWEANLRGPAAQGAINGYAPVDILNAYKMPANGGINAIAIVDAFDNPTALTDFNTFSRQFGLPQETSADRLSNSNKVLQVVYAAGVVPPTDTGWAGEISLDIEWAHAIAPKAKIFLVECASSSGPDLFNGTFGAPQIPGVKQVSMSWGSSETSVQTQLDPAFLTVPGVVFFASTGDTGGTQSYPATSPNVVSVGGTNLQVTPAGTVLSETAWSDSGAGPSRFETRPAYQNVIAGIVGSARGTADCSADADPATGVAVFSQTAFGGWAVVGGTSLACPLVAAMTNLRGSFSTSSVTELNRIYSNLGSRFYRDITQGSAGSFTARPGWDFITGVGSPVGLYTSIAIPPPVTLAPISASAMEGTVISGTVANLARADSVDYTVETRNEGAIGVVGSAQITLKLDRPITGYSSMQLLIDSNLPMTATQMLYVWDWQTSSFTYLGAKPGTATMSEQATDVFSLLPHYVNASTQQIRFLVRSVRPARFGTSLYPEILDSMRLVGQPTG
jgi:subtilase family serine protease